MAALAGWVSGCVQTVDGRQQAGMPFVKDSFEGQYQRSVPQILTASKAVLSKYGVLSAENTLNNSLEAKVNQNKVIVRVDNMDSAGGWNKVVVQVRGPNGGTDLDLAHQIEKEIALKLAAS